MAGFQEPPSKKVKKDDSFTGGNTGHIVVQQSPSRPSTPHARLLKSPGFSPNNGTSNGNNKLNTDMSHMKMMNGIPSFNESKKMKSENNNPPVNQNGVPRGIKNMDNLKNISKQRRSLPIFPVSGKLLEELKKSDTVIIIGETGSGKTTQIPQYIHEERWDRAGMICISQPRRVAAVTVAKRVAEEMNTDIGGLVGYTVRFEDTCSTGVTKLKYATDGMILREAISDPFLMKYAWIILDEAHERTISTDVLFGIVKAAQKKRKSEGKEPLKIIVMSATMDVDHFSQYFDSAPVLYLEGRQHPIEMFYAREKQDDYRLACMSTVFQIHKEAPAQDDILVFLTGQEEIDGVTRTIRQIAKDNSLEEYPKLRVFPLYAALPQHQQLDVFRKTASGERKVIVSTNIAETSITIPGIRYVVDSGRSKLRCYQPGSGLETLKVKKISQAQAWQRAGRAGRERAGFCYRSYTLEEFNTLDLNPTPEILRSNLASVILQLLAIGIKNISTFDFIDAPKAESIKEAIEQLLVLEAVTVSGDGLSLTPLGMKMASFPLDPRYSKIIISGPEYGCTVEVLSIIAILSSESVYVNPMGKKDQATEVRRKFTSVEGDHISLLKIYRAFRGITNSKLWCKDNFLNHRNLTHASEVRQQLVRICNRCSINIVSCQQNLESVRKCLITGLFTNIAELQYDGKYLTLDGRQEAAIYPASVLHGGKPPYILFSELLQTGKNYMHSCTPVEADWLVEIAPEYFRKRHIKKSRV